MNKSVRILCISDQIDPLVYSLRAKERFRHIDLVLSAGDLDLSYYGFITSLLNKPLLFVFGNHNLQHIADFRREYDQTLDPFAYNPTQTKPAHGSRYIGGKIVRVEGLIIAGLGGSKRYNRGKNQFTEKGMFFRFLRLIPKMLYYRRRYGRWLDILLTHAPPFGIHDKEDTCHQGFTFFNWFIRFFKPKYFIHGHVHLYDINAQRITHTEQTTVVNVFSHTEIEVEVPS